MNQIISDPTDFEQEMQEKVNDKFNLIHRTRKELREAFAQDDTNV